MSSEKIISDVAEGATKAAWSIGKEELKNIVDRFKNGDLFFINDRRTLDDIKKQRKTSEFVTIKKHVSDSSHRALIATGISARGLSDEKLKKLYQDVRFAHGAEGLAIIHLVENNLLTRYFSHLVSMGFNTKKLAYELNDFLKNVTTRVQFIESSDNPTKRARTAVSQLTAHLPIMYMLSSVTGATTVCTRTANKIKPLVVNYKVETVTLSHPKRKIYLFIRML